MKEEITETVEIPEGVQASVEGRTVTVQGEKGSISREFPHPQVDITTDGEITLHCKKGSNRERTIIKSYTSHLRNMVEGVVEGHHYELKVCSGHFPMNVSLQGDTLEVKNFLGEKQPRTLPVLEGVDVKVEDDTITVDAVDKELAGQMAANIERLTRITNKDRRIFQDGIYMTIKDGKELV